MHFCVLAIVVFRCVSVGSYGSLKKSLLKDAGSLTHCGRGRLEPALEPWCRIRKESLRA
jgi:hypothetical protein